jgi:hypothetical protein
MLTLAQACIARANCDLGQLLVQHRSLVLGAGDHPHPDVRGEFTQALVTVGPKNDTTRAMLGLAQVLARNTEALWEKVEPFFQAEHKRVRARADQ